MLTLIIVSHNVDTSAAAAAAATATATSINHAIAGIAAVMLQLAVENNALFNNTRNTSWENIREGTIL